MNNQNLLASDITKAFLAMERPGVSGMELTVCMMQRSKKASDWTWALIRYPVDINDTTPTETIKDFQGMKWPEIIEWVHNYLTENLVDGFGYC